MNLIDSNFSLLPELFFMWLALYWGLDNYLGSGVINYPIFTLLVIMGIQLFAENVKIGLVMGILLVGGTIYMSLALLSDITMVITWDFQAIRFLLTGGVLIALAYIMSIWMIMKHAKAMKKKVPNHFDTYG